MQCSCYSGRYLAGTPESLNLSPSPLFAETRGVFPRILQPKRRIKDSYSIAELCTEKIMRLKGKREQRRMVAGAEAGGRVTGVRIPRRIGG